ncbi:tetratricopeptide repeat protein [Planctomycetota bacterium]
MAIPKKDNFNRMMIYLALISSVILIQAEKSYADVDETVEILKASYKLPLIVTTAQAELVAAGLEDTLSDCNDDHLAARVKYRIGVIYFKASMMNKSKDKFLQITNDPQSPKFIRICSFNMIGQISRLIGADGEALEAFDQVVSLIGQEKVSAADLAPVRLVCSALFSRAEIYELQKNYAASIAEYNRLVDMLKNSDMFNQYMALVIDRMSQLYLRQGNVDKYKEVAKVLIVDCPQYYRTPLIKLEIECAMLLKKTSPNFDFKNSSFDLPVQIIAYFKDSTNPIWAESITTEFEKLCKNHTNTYAGILLKYHYAWLLDTLGEKEKAAEMFAQVFSTNTIDTVSKSWKKANIENIQEYAKIQHAIILGEKAEYKRALSALNNLQTHPDNSHLSKLAKSVINGLHILKKEVPKNDHKEK